MTRPASPRRRLLLSHGDARIDVVTEGSGPTLVLLPSSLRDSLDFDDLAELLALRGFQVLRPQPRGMGRSSPPPPDMTLDTLAGDVAAVVAQLVHGPALVAGHAYGHWVARVAAWRHPAQVRGLVLMAAAARTFPDGMAQALAVASDPAQPEAARLEALRLCMFAPGNDPRPWLDGWHPQWRAAYRAAAQRPPRTEWQHPSQIPVLDLQGSDDAWRPPSSRDEFSALLGTGVTVRSIPGAGHAMVPEQPLAVADAIADWAHVMNNPR